jgi:hypothetical protein
MKITTLMGGDRDIDPAAITIITGPGPGDPLPCCRIFGVAPTYVRVAQDAAAFIATLSNAANFARFKFAQGANFWSNALMVSSIQAATPDDQIKFPLCNSVLSFPKADRYIQEEVAVAVGLINAAGGNL